MLRLTFVLASDVIGNVADFSTSSKVYDCQHYIINFLIHQYCKTINNVTDQALNCVHLELKLNYLSMSYNN